MNGAQHILIGLVRVYRWTVSPVQRFLFGPLSGCRFTPTCSEYGAEAIRAHGAIAGVWMALKRIGRCHPWGGCGYDPVPSPLGRTENRHSLLQTKLDVSLPEDPISTRLNRRRASACNCQHGS